jgi:hypothetical protein
MLVCTFCLNCSGQINGFFQFLPFGKVQAAIKKPEVFYFPALYVDFENFWQNDKTLKNSLN